jgi:hypothetical protein
MRRAKVFSILTPRNSFGWRHCRSGSAAADRCCKSFANKRKHVGLVCGIVGRLHEDGPRSFIEALLAGNRVRGGSASSARLDTGYQQFVREACNLPWVDFRET